VADVLEVCTHVAAEPLPRIFPVAGGFLLLLQRPVTEWIPRTIRLRRLSGNLFVPADAELIPSLLEDELEALGRTRGLVFLPGGKVLGFAPDCPLALSTLVTGPTFQRRAWQSLPPPPSLADRLQEINLELPMPPVEEILSGEGQDIGTEEPQPEDAGTTATLSGQVGMGIGRALVGLGNLFGMRGLAGMGAEMIRRALEKAPRLSERLLGRQEAALRALLRRFREGDVDEALRRAVPLEELGRRGGSVPAEPRLPFNNLVYSLNSLLARWPGPVGVFLASIDVRCELENEYRKAAVQAALRGDYRRAAYIYGKLLRDFRMAANTLAQGGLHHDAAILYLVKLQDTYAAARAFESVGEFDRAIKLYRQRGDHVLAADLLRRTGDEEAALVEYCRAAEELAAGGGHLAAGDMLLTRAGLPDLAKVYFDIGWGRRPDPNAIACALRLARLHVDQERTDSLLALVTEADAYLADPGKENEASQFYNEVARLANRKELKAVRGDLRDRALLGLATKLRQRAAVETRPGNLISELFGRGHPWPSALVSDAHYALQGALRPATPPGRVNIISAAVIRTQTGIDTVTAARSAPTSGDLFLGFHSGAIVCFRPWTNELVRLPVTPGPVSALAVDPEGKFLVALQAIEGTPGLLTSFTRNLNGTYQLREKRSLPEPGEGWLTPLVVKGTAYLLGLWWNGRFTFLHRLSLLPGAEPLVPQDLEFALLFPGSTASASPILWLGAARMIWYLPTLEPLPRSHDYFPRTSLGWQSGRPPRCSMQMPALSWYLREPCVLELAGLNSTGVLHWSLAEWPESDDLLPRATTSVAGPGYAAAAILRPGFLAGVRQDQVDWLHRLSGGIHLKAQSRVALSAPVACFPSEPTHELLVVGSEGSITRVPVPN
jgi:tetratricopeptide (TPR) repeat protein